MFIVDVFGNYVFFVMNEEIGCFSIVDVIVVVSVFGFVVDIVVLDILNCVIEFVILDGSGLE